MVPAVRPFLLLHQQALLLLGRLAGPADRPVDAGLGGDKLEVVDELGVLGVRYSRLGTGQAAEEKTRL